MSEFYVKVVEIGKVGKHPNADNLSITQIMDGYPVIFQTGQFKQGDKAVYVSVDALVPLTDERWKFLSDTLKPFSRIRAKKLRGIFSMGILTHADPSWEVGQDVQAELSIGKWEPQIELTTGGAVAYDPGHMPYYTDLEGLRRYSAALVQGEEVVITEKIHGSNARFVYKDGELWVGSRTQYRAKPEDTDAKRSVWWEVAKKYNLASVLSEYPGLALFGEVYGHKIQDLEYGCKDVELAVFDIYNTDTKKYLDFDAFAALSKLMGVPMAPVLYQGPWSDDLKSWAEGKTILGKGAHVREGFVVRPVQERWDHKVGRVVLKFVGEGYLTRKNAE